MRDDNPKLNQLVRMGLNNSKQSDVNNPLGNDRLHHPKMQSKSQNKIVGSPANGTLTINKNARRTSILPPKTVYHYPHGFAIPELHLIKRQRALPSFDGRSGHQNIKWEHIDFKSYLSYGSVFY